MFNSGDLEYVDAVVAVDAIDHQEPEGVDMGAHLKQVIATLRTAFPDLHYDADGRVTDLWHVWNTLALARQIGAPAPDLRVSAAA
jgi:hypothetical protein